jgi:hypothetical protein
MSTQQPAFSPELRRDITASGQAELSDDGEHTLIGFKVMYTISAQFLYNASWTSPRCHFHIASAIAHATMFTQGRPVSNKSQKRFSDPSSHSLVQEISLQPTENDKEFIVVLAIEPSPGRECVIVRSTQTTVSKSSVDARTHNYLFTEFHVQLGS